MAWLARICPDLPANVRVFLKGFFLRAAGLLAGALPLAFFGFSVPESGFERFCARFSEAFGLEAT
jgi:hypothetical protein